MESSVAVVGGGISGLVCAYELQKAGIQVTVFEKDSFVGGRLLTRRKNRYPFDIGAQFLNNGYIEIKRYAEELGLKHKWKTMHPSTHHLFYEGELHCISFTTHRELVRMPVYSFLSRIRLLVTYLRLRQRSKGLNLYDLSTIDPSLDEQSAAQFALKWGGARVLDLGIDAMVHTYHFHKADELSLSCLLAACAALDDRLNYEYLEGGMDSLAKAFAERVSVELQTLVTAVTPKPDGVCIEVDGKIRHFDRVVLAIPASAARAIYGRASPAQDTLLQNVHFSSTITVGFWVPQKLVWQLAMVVVPQSQSRLICCYFNQHSKYAEYLEKGKTIVNVFLRDSFARGVLEETNEAIFSQVKQEFIRVCPALKEHAHKVCAYDLQRWKEAIPKYYPGYVQLVRKFWEEHQGERNVFFCGDYMNSPWIEGAACCGKKVAHALQKSLENQKQSDKQPTASCADDMLIL